MKENVRKFDTQEFELPETVFSSDIENRVFQGIILQSLSKIAGVGLLEGGFIDHLLRRDGERIKGIHVEQDPKNPFVSIKVEINIEYGLSIPKKAEEIQTKVVEEITHLTNLHVASIHVVFKGLVVPRRKEEEGSFSSTNVETEDPLEFSDK